ncbi:hypothetical protein E2C01_012272 [Portunus trituberculatus]|uniref:Uncharacterized protein n=1 Tax=Portunus trituberculatus TaxID=210409 RepID=A0A5B7DDP8_PORTR|nr:hypothetical protein [Portunus trituberculatus]
MDEEEKEEEEEGKEEEEKEADETCERDCSPVHPLVTKVTAADPHCSRNLPGAKGHICTQVSGRRDQQPHFWTHGDN